MATTEYRKIQIRRDTAANFAAVVLADGEPAWYNDTKRLVMGDGVTAGGIKLNPMTAVGDVVVGGTAGAATRLAVGSAGQILTVSAGSPVWSSTIAAATTFSSGTASTSTTTGSVIVTGGLGVSGAAFIGSNLVVGTGAATVFLATHRGTTAQNNFHRWQTGGVDNWAVGSGATGTNTDLEFYSYGIPGRSFVVAYATGNVTFDRAVTTGGGTANAINTLNAAAASTSALIFQQAGTEVGRIQFSNTTTMAITTGSGVSSAILIDSSQKVTINAGTASTSSSTGSLVCNGGVGIAGALFVAGDINTGNGSSKVYAVGGPNTAPATSGSTANHSLRYGAASQTGIVVDMGIDSASSSAWIQVRDVANFANNYTLKLNPNGGAVSVGGFTLTPSGGHINLTSTAANPYLAIVDGAVTAFLQAASGAASVYVGSVSAHNVSIMVNAVGVITVSSTVVTVVPTTASTSTTTGALTVAGGVGIAGALYVGGDEVISNPTGRAALSFVGGQGGAKSYVLENQRSGVSNTGFEIRNLTDARSEMFFDGGGNVSVPAGAIRTAAPSGGTAADWKFGVVSVTSPTAPNRTIELDVGGTRYFLHAKTTND